MTSHGQLLPQGTWTALLFAAVWVLAGPGPQTVAAEPNGSDSSDSQRGTILVLGDSIAAGYGLEPSQAFPALLQERIDEAGFPFTVVNAGVSGDTSAGGLRRINWLLKRKIDVLILELGGNDGLRGISPETTRKNLGAIIDRARERYPDIQIILAGMQMPPNLGSDYVKRFNQIYPDLAKEQKTLLIPFILEGVGGRPDLNLPDRIHPAAKGQKIVADNVWNVLRPLLERMVQSAQEPPQEAGS